MHFVNLFTPHISPAGLTRIENDKMKQIIGKNIYNCLYLLRSQNLKLN